MVELFNYCLHGRGDRPVAPSALFRYLCPVFLILSIVGITARCLSAEISDKTQTYPIIYAIEIVGNRVTSAELILREMKLKPGMVATPEALREDQLHIASLGLFNRVEMMLASDEGRAVVQVVVTEPFYIYPYTSMEYEIDKPDKTVLGLGLYHYNFQGQGKKIGAVGIWGYEQGFKIFHDDPWFSIGGEYGMSGRIYYTDAEVMFKEEPIRRESRGIRFSINRRMKIRHSLEFGMGWREISSDSTDYTLATGNRDRIFSLHLRRTNDQRDYRYYPSSGYYIALDLEANRLVDIPHDFFRETVNLRNYRTIGPVIFAGRAWCQLGQYSRPYYHRLSVGGREIRAGDIENYKDGIFTGGSLELRFNIIKPFYLSFENIPLLGPYLRNLMFSLEGVVFCDRGFYIDSKLNLDDDFQAYGFGLQAQLPYIKIIHVTFGWTPSLRLNDPDISFRDDVTF